MDHSSIAFEYIFLTYESTKLTGEAGHQMIGAFHQQSSRAKLPGNLLPILPKHFNDFLHCPLFPCSIAKVVEVESLLLQFEKGQVLIGKASGKISFVDRNASAFSHFKRNTMRQN